MIPAHLIYSAADPNSRYSSSLRSAQLRAWEEFDPEFRKWIIKKQHFFIAMNVQWAGEFTSVEFRGINNGRKMYSLFYYNDLIESPVYRVGYGDNYGWTNIYEDTDVRKLSNALKKALDWTCL